MVQQSFDILNICFTNLVDKVDMMVKYLPHITIKLSYATGTSGVLIRSKRIWR